MENLVPLPRAQLSTSKYSVNEGSRVNVTARRCCTTFLVFFSLFTGSLHALSLVDLESHLKEYGSCEVAEVRDEDYISYVSLTCKALPNQDNKQAWVRISISFDGALLVFKPPEPLSRTETSVRVRYRFDEEEFKEDSFEFHDFLLYPYASKKIDRDELSEFITAIEKAKSIEFDLDGKSSTVSKITLDKSAEAVKDFRNRIKLLDDGYMFDDEE